MSNQPPQPPGGWGPPPGPPTGPQGQGWGSYQQSGQGWGYPPQAPQGPQGPRPNKPIYKRGWVIALGIIVGLAVIGNNLPDEATTQSTTGQAELESVAESTETSSEALPKVGDAVRDGDFEFIVTAFQCSGGQCRAQMRVENIGSDPGTMFASNQYLYDDKGRKFEADDDSDDPLFLRELNPGAKVSGKIVWRVGQGVKANKLELHDSAFSGGTEVYV